MAMGPNGDGIWGATEYERCYGADGFTGLNTPNVYWSDPAWWRRYYEQKIVPAFGTVSGAQRILVVGCGMGLLVNAINNIGFATAAGIDASADVVPFWGANPTRFRQRDIRANRTNSLTTQDMRAMLNNQTDVQWVITESVLECYQPAEQAAIQTACESWLARGTPTSHVVHLVYDGVDMTRWPSGRVDPTTATGYATWSAPPGELGVAMANPGCPPRTIAEWQASRTGHTFLSIYGVA